MATIDLYQVTNAEGDGIFDELMKAVNSQIETQYLNNRITGTDYANVYLSSLQSVLSQSIDFYLRSELTEVQIDTALVDKQIKEFQLNSLLPEELTKVQEEIDLLQEQAKGAFADRVVKDKQAAKLGLDNVMKQSEAAKAVDSGFVYSPRYDEGA